MSSGVYSPHAASAGTPKGKFKGKKKGRAGDNLPLPSSTDSASPARVKARPGCCRPAEFHAPDIERTQLSPGAVEGLELVPPLRDGQGEAPRAPAAWELGWAGFTAGPT